MKRACATAVLLLLAFGLATPCLALTSQAIDSSRFEQRPGALLPLDLKIRDSDGADRALGDFIGGKPALLFLTDYNCRILCGAATDVLADRLEQTGLVPGDDYRTVIFGFNPKSAPRDAKAFASAHGSTAPAKTFHHVVAAPAEIERLSRAVGFRAVYDPATDQYAHPAGVITIGSDNRISRYLDILTVAPADLRLALVEAGQGRVGSIRDQIILTCYGWDGEKGVYSPLVHRILAVAGTLTVLLIAAALFLTLRSERLRINAASEGSRDA